MDAVIVAYEGVLADEIEAFECVLSRVRDVNVVTAGGHVGDYAGPGGRTHASVPFHEVYGADIVVVPGGLGCERAANDAPMLAFLDRVGRRARFVTSSSTGSVVLASAGLLGGEPAATHWLAGDLLRRYGSAVAPDGLVTRGNTITCAGTLTALEAAFTIAERVEGPAAPARIKAALLEDGRHLLAGTSWWRRAIEAVRRRRSRARPAVTRPGADDAAWRRPDVPVAVMVELVDDEETARRLRRSALRRRAGR
jgi:putative intracellular protease/amidase